VYIEVTGIEESGNDEIVTVTIIYTMNGQCLMHNNVSDLSNGVYVLQGITSDGQTVSRKIVVNK
jgi:hypothetical protein